MYNFYSNCNRISYVLQIPINCTSTEIHRFCYIGQIEKIPNAAPVMMYQSENTLSSGPDDFEINLEKYGVSHVITDSIEFTFVKV